MSAAADERADYPAYDAVVFDLGGVLIDWDPRRLYRALLPDEETVERFLAEVCTLEWNHEQDSGRPLAEGTAALQAEHPEHAELIAAYYGRWPEMLGGVIRGTESVLRELHGAGIPVLALTNWSAETFPVARERYELLGLFDGVVVSGEERLAKPAPGVFRVLCERYGVRPASTLYIDDSMTNVEAAEGVGFAGILFTTPERLRADLVDRGLLPPPHLATRPVRSRRMSLLATLLGTRTAQVVDLQEAAAGEAGGATDAGGPADPGDPAAARYLVRTDDTGTMQLYEYDGGSLRQLTDFAEPVLGRYVPGSRSAVVAIDAGGNERHQLYLLDLDDPPGADRSRLTPLAVDPAYIHAIAGVSRDGRLLGYTSNRRNGVDFDVYVRDLGSGAERCLFDGGGWCSAASGFSPDGRWLAVLRPGERPMDVDLLLLEVATGGVTVALPHPDEAAVVGAPAWVDETTFYVSSNVGRDVRALVRCDAVDGTTTVAVEREWDLDCWASGDGSTLLVVANADGASRAELRDAHTLAPRGEVPLPAEGVVAFTHLLPEPLLSRDGRRVAYSFSSPRQGGTAYVHDTSTGRTTLLAAGASGVDPGGLAVPERHRVASFDGEQLPVLLFRPGGTAGRPGDPGQPDSAASPDTAAPPPVVVLVHGGPEGQSTLVFNPVVQGLVAEGYAVVVPNVRGSTGYGKRYYGLDDTVRRLDSVRDLAALHAWLPSAGLDEQRAVLWGGSYGGYMVLAGCAFQPELWAAGVDIVGISDLVTFLENTSDYRRVYREQEYGSLADDREFLASASPLRRVDDMRAPLFVIHGANDPRVPLSEAEQLVASLRERDVPCELLVYADEGHGLAKLANRLDAYPRAVEFLGRMLRHRTERTQRRGRP